LISNSIRPRSSESGMFLSFDIHHALSKVKAKGNRL
jgi:hypothetical protein